MEHFNTVSEAGCPVKVWDFYIFSDERIELYGEQDEFALAIQEHYRHLLHEVLGLKFVEPICGNLMFWDTVKPRHNHENPSGTYSLGSWANRHMRYIVGECLCTIDWLTSDFCAYIFVDLNSFPLSGGTKAWEKVKHQDNKKEWLNWYIGYERHLSVEYSLLEVFAHEAAHATGLHCHDTVIGKTYEPSYGWISKYGADRTTEHEKLAQKYLEIFKARGLE